MKECYKDVEERKKDIRKGRSAFEDWKEGSVTEGQKAQNDAQQEARPETVCTLQNLPLYQHVTHKGAPKTQYLPAAAPAPGAETRVSVPQIYFLKNNSNKNKQKKTSLCLFTYTSLCHLSNRN